MNDNIRRIIRLLDLNDIVYWSVSTATGDNKKVFDSIEDETLDARKARFIEVMDLYTGGRFILTGKKNKTDSRGLFQYEFENLKEGTSASVAGLQPTVTGMTDDKVKEMIAAERVNWERDLELKNLREEKKELEATVKEHDTAFNRILMKLEPHIGNLAGVLMSKIIPAGPAVALGTTTQQIFKPQNNNSDQMDNSEIQDVEIEATENRLEIALEKWQTADPENFVRLIEFISDFAANGKTISPFPGVNLNYTQITEMLK